MDQGGLFARLRQIARDSHDRIVGLVLDDLGVDGYITKVPGGGECAGRSPGVGMLTPHAGTATPGDTG